MLVKKSNQLKYKSKIRKEKISDDFLRMKKIEFSKELMNIYLSGGRILSVPLKQFPEIARLSIIQRSKYHIAAGVSLDFEDSDEVYHLNELLGITKLS
jgi:hypothetical protein